MSGPLEEVSEITPGLGISAIEVQKGRSVNIGRMGVLRVLPILSRGAWGARSRPVVTPRSRVVVFVDQTAEDVMAAELSCDQRLRLAIAL